MIGVVLLLLVLFDREAAKSVEVPALLLRRLALFDRELGLVLCRPALLDREVGVVLLLLGVPPNGEEGKSAGLLLVQLGVVVDGEIGKSVGMEFLRLALLDKETPNLVGVWARGGVWLRPLELFDRKEGSWKKPSSMLRWK